MNTHFLKLSTQRLLTWLVVLLLACLWIVLSAAPALA